MRAWASRPEPRRVVALHLGRCVPADRPGDDAADARGTREVLERATRAARRDPVAELEDLGDLVEQPPRNTNA